MNPLRRFFRFVADVYWRYARDAGSFLAATISYYALFSIFPLFLLSISAAGFFLERAGLTAQILDYTDTVVPQFSGIIKSNVEAIAVNRQSAGLIGLAALVWIGAAVFDAIEYALGRVWRVPVGRHFILAKLLSIAGVIAVIMLLLLTTLASTAFEAFQAFWRDTFIPPPPLAAVGITTFLAGLAITFSALMIIYTVIPNRQLSFRDVWVGALAATVSMELAKRLFILYTTRLAKFNAIYGSVGVIVGLLFWLYIIGNILVVGAEISAVWVERRSGPMEEATGD